MDKLWQDIQYGLRMMRRAPGFTAVAILSLALGIGANTAIFTLANAVLWEPLPVRDPSRLVSINTTDERNQGFMGISQPNFTDLRDHSHQFSGMYCLTGGPVNVLIGREPKQLIAFVVSGNYFDVLGAKPMLGRTFYADEDQQPGRNPVLVLSYSSWQRDFAADPSIVGKQITLNNGNFNVIGVMPKGFNGTNPLFAPSMWIPLAMHDQVLTGTAKQWFNERRALLFQAVGRLKPGVSREQAESELKSIFSGLVQNYPVPNRGRSVALRPLLEANAGPGNVLARAAALMMVIVGLVLLIACANIANLLLARASGRSKEIAVRLALGASRGRLMTQLVIESLLLSLAGAALGLGVAVFARDLLWNLRPPFLQNSPLELGLDGRVLVFTLGVAILTGVLFGLAPALQITRPDLVLELKEKSTQAASGPNRGRLRSGLVVIELAFALITLVAAGLFLVSLRNAQQIDPGFDAKHLAVLSMDLGAQGYSQPQAHDFFKAVQERVSAIPGVAAASLADNTPLFGGGFARSVFPEGTDVNQRNGVLVAVDTIAPHYFDTLRIPLLKGRDLDEQVRANDPKYCVVNESFAKRFFPGQDPIGKRFKFFGDNDYTQVIGLVKDSKYNTVGEESTPYIYLPDEQNFAPAMTLFVRAKGDPGGVLPAVRSQVQAMDPHLPLTDVYVMDNIMSQALWGPRIAASLLAVFAGVALVLAAIGIYGVMSYSVTQRVREIGIRMALGARPRDVLRMLLRQGMVLVCIGLGGGLLVAFLLARLIAQLLYDVHPTNPLTFAAVTVLLAIVGLLASFLPAQRAMRVEPMEALRYE